MSRLPVSNLFHHRVDLQHNVGHVDGGAISDNGGAVVTVTAGTGFLRIADSDLADLKYIAWDENASLSIASDTTAYIGIKYNSGSPVIFQTTDITDMNGTTAFSLGTVVNVADSLIINQQVHGVNVKSEYHISLFNSIPGVQFDQYGIVDVPVTIVTTNITLTADYKVWLVNATSGAVTITLPAANINSGRVYHIKKIDTSANAVTIVGTIDDAASRILTSQYDSIKVIFNAIAWSII